MCQIKFKILGTNFQNLRSNLHIGSFVQEGVQKRKDSSFTVINNKDKQQILTFKRLEPANVWHENVWNDQKSYHLSLDFRVNRATKTHLIKIKIKVQTAQKWELS